MLLTCCCVRFNNVIYNNTSHIVNFPAKGILLLLRSLWCNFIEGNINILSNDHVLHTVCCCKRKMCFSKRVYFHLAETVTPHLTHTMNQTGVWHHPMIPDLAQRTPLPFSAHQVLWIKTITSGSLMWVETVCWGLKLSTRMSMGGFCLSVMMC